MTSRSDELFESAKKRIPGGVNSPVRAFRNLGITPPFIASGKGSHLHDVDGREYIDYVGSWGPLVFGHAHPRVLDAVQQALAKGTSFGAPTELEVRIAERICDMVPSVEMVRMVNSGTEAAMSAVRLARGVTGRDGIIKFAGCYHGHGDSFLIKAGSGALTIGVPDSPGVPSGLAKDTLVARYNDPGSVAELFEEHRDRIAAVIVEPVAGNMGVIPPSSGFLAGLRHICDRYRSLLIFDEVITGFRLGRGGAQERFGVLPDLTVLGKIVGGGLPAAAYGGKRELMEQLAPAGPVYQAGTLSGNPLAMSAGLAQLELLEEEKPWNRLEEISARLEGGLRDALGQLGLNLTINRVGSMMTLFFTEPQVKDFADATRSDTDRHAAFCLEMLQRGVYLAPSQFEALFISVAHTDQDVERTIEAGRASLEKVFAS
ncbi:MAG: glutamate-1-semialdehyde 2,1-aminomutase [Vicinamibacteria bacterium]